MRIISFSICFTAFLSGCFPSERQAEVEIVFENDKAVALVIPKSLMKGSDARGLYIMLASDNNQVAVLGEIKEDGDGYRFTPLVPLTLGLHYHVLDGMDVIGEVNVPESDAPAPELLAIYPPQDTLALNLLKMYFEFSAPMVEGKILAHISLLKNGLDTMKGTFLDLQPELWNEEGTVLTLWLDPGRIKQDLIPNKELGNPLEEGAWYTLSVAADWKSRDGKALGRPMKKPFYVGRRDSSSPKADEWKVSAPTAATGDSLKVEFGEPLDHELITHAITVKNARGTTVEGTISTRRDITWVFAPSSGWERGKYSIEFESRIEDLAGNNLNRLFEEDLTNKSRSKDQPLYKRTFSIP